MYHPASFVFETRGFVFETRSSPKPGSFVFETPRFGFETPSFGLGSLCRNCTRDLEVSGIAQTCEYYWSWFTFSFFLTRRQCKKHARLIQNEKSNMLISIFERWQSIPSLFRLLSLGFNIFRQHVFRSTCIAVAGMIPLFCINSSWRTKMTNFTRKLLTLCLLAISFLSSVRPWITNGTGFDSDSSSLVLPFSCRRRHFLSHKLTYTFFLSNALDV